VVGQSKGVEYRAASAHPVPALAPQTLIGPLAATTEAGDFCRGHAENHSRLTLHPQLNATQNEWQTIFRTLS